MEKRNTCTICQTEVNQNFCPNCGQKVSYTDTTIQSLVTDFFSNLFSLEKSVFAAILKIITNPKTLIVNYWSGYRKYYPSPGKLLVYSLAIAALHLAYVNKELLGLAFDFKGNAQLIFWSIFFPILTMTSYLSFWRQKYSFTKHVISIAYIASSFFIIGTLINDLLLLLNIQLSALPFFLFAVAVFIWNARIFSPQSSFFKIALYLLLQIIVFAFIIFLIVGLIYLIIPDSISFGE